MELVGFVKSLLRHKAVLGAILAVATLAAFLTAFKVGPGGIERRSTSVGAGTSQILVDSAESTLVKGAASDQLAALGTRASVYAQYLSSREAVGKIAREMKIDPLLITASGPFSEGTGIRDYGEQGAESRATALTEEGKAYRLVFQAQEDVPIITVYATAPTVAASLELAHSSYKVLSGYIDELKVQAAKEEKVNPEPKPAVSATAPLINDIIVRQLGQPEGGLVGGSADLMLMVLAFVGVFGIGCLVFAISSGFLRHWRLAGEMERLDAQAAHPWEPKVPAHPPIDPSDERWGLPGPEEPSDPDREGGPAISGR
jgi:hypothetical protein